MKRTLFWLTVYLLPFQFSSSGDAQPIEIPRVGLLNSNVVEAFKARTGGFRQVCENSDS